MEHFLSQFLGLGLASEPARYHSDQCSNRREPLHTVRNCERCGLGSVPKAIDEKLCAGGVIALHVEQRQQLDDHFVGDLLVPDNAHHRDGAETRPASDFACRTMDNVHRTKMPHIEWVHGLVRERFGNVM
jgi:hypothetical protein